jgi:hypothetical protein
MKCQDIIRPVFVEIRPAFSSVWRFLDSSHFINKACVEKRGLMMKSKAPGILLYNYTPELDGSAELDDKRATYYQSLIGILRWAVELGQIDICTEVSVVVVYGNATGKSFGGFVSHICLFVYSQSF